MKSKKSFKKSLNKHKGKRINKKKHEKSYPFFHFFKSYPKNQKYSLKQLKKNNKKIVWPRFWISSVLWSIP